MNTKLFSVALLSGSLVFAQGAFAAGPEVPAAPVYVAAANAPITLTRAEVKQEARLAELSHQIPRGQQAWPDASWLAPSTLSRAQVKAETRLAVASESIPRGQQNFVRYDEPSSNLSRADVKAEARFAETHHQLARGEANVNQ